jgi:hypothetical protein
LNPFRLAKLTLFFLLVILAFSCTKDLAPIGLDLVPPGELIKMGYSDTVQITAFSVREDSVRTNTLSYALIGSMNDPVFGRTTADWFSQIRLSKEPTNFGRNAVFDSAFLLLPYNGSYGDTLSNMTIRVFELTDDILDSVHQYSNNTIGYDLSHPLGEFTFTPLPHDSAFFNGEKQAPILRIPLNSRFGDKAMLTDTSLLSTNASFIGQFKGIAIIAEPQQATGKGAIIRMTISAGYSKVDMYYHNSTDTSIYSFGINSDCKRFGHYEHEDYSGAAPMLTQQIAGDSALGEQFLFLQAMGGVRVKLRFPNLKSWFDSQKVIINDAQLIFTNASSSNTFSPPAAISLYPIADDGTLYPYQLPDADEGSSYFDGTYNSTAGTYRFRLSHYVQQIMNGNQSDNGLFLVIPGSSLSANRLVLNGTGSPSSGLKLYIKYTIVK